MSDKAKAQWRTWLGSILLIGGFIGGMIVRLVSGPGLLPFLIVSSGFILGLALLALNGLWKSAPLANTMSKIVTGLALLCLLIGLYFFLAVDNLPYFYLFIGLSAIGPVSINANKARLTAGVVRKYYLGSTASSMGLIITMLTQALIFNHGLSLSAIGFPIGIALMSVGLLLVATNQEAFRAYYLQQHNQQQLLDSTKADPFYGEQLKPDRVKEQR